MGMFDWWGRSKREEAWMAEPRRLPHGIDDTTEDTRWIMSHEFVNNEHKNIRQYMAARYNDRDQNWTISLYKTDLKHDIPGRAFYAEYDVDFTDDPMAVVTALANFDRQYRRSEEYSPIEGHRGTYRPFANKYGIHFDDDGNIMKVKQDTRLVKGTFLNKDSIDNLFHKDAPKALDSWEQVYAQVVNVWPAEWTLTEAIKVPAKILVPETPAPAAAAEGQAHASGNAADGRLGDNAVEGSETPAVEEPAVEATPQPAPEPKFDIVNVTRPITLADLAADPAYPEFGWEMGKTLAALKDLPAQLKDKSSTITQKERLVTAFAKAADIRAPFEGSKALLAQRLAKATLLVGLLRTGEDVYTEQVIKGNFSPEGMRLAAAFSTAVTTVAQGNFGLDPALAGKVSDVMSKGHDPYGPQLPVEKVFAQFPPAAYTPPAPDGRGSNGRFTPRF
ncbi:MAG TPA: hypothetical protein VEF76_06755 [Patescibacteria group bacterium]|nr:hypothetical protein [Patescibacteria group bacterium]